MKLFEPELASWWDEDGPSPFIFVSRSSQWCGLLVAQLEPVVRIAPPEPVVRGFLGQQLGGPHTFELHFSPPKRWASPGQPLQDLLLLARVTWGAELMTKRLGKDELYGQFGAVDSKLETPVAGPLSS